MDNLRVDEIEARHARAVAEGKDTYVDPESEYEVFTAAFLTRRGICCGSGCRHCPFEYVNVEPPREAESRDAPGRLRKVLLRWMKKKP
jgi:hypothetical protein